MIDIRDLQLGNYILYNDVEYVVTTKDFVDGVDKRKKTIITCVNRINDENTLAQDWQDESVEITAPNFRIDMIEAIPFNLECFTRLGFEMIEENRLYRKQIHKGKDLFVEKMTGNDKETRIVHDWICFLKTGDKSVKIPTQIFGIHHLQNIIALVSQKDSL